MALRERQQCAHSIDNRLVDIAIRIMHFKRGQIHFLLGGRFHLSKANQPTDHLPQGFEGCQKHDKGLIK